MQMTDRQHDTIDIEIIHPGRARIRTSWPVSSPRGETSIATGLLSEALQEGVEVLPKPFTYKDLAAKVRQVLDA